LTPPLPHHNYLILDTNIWLDWLLFSEQSFLPLAALIQSMPNRTFDELVYPSAARDELAIVLARPVLQEQAARRAALGRSPAPQSIDACLRQFDSLAQGQLAPEMTCPLKCRDPDDQKFLDLAVLIGTQSMQNHVTLLSKDRHLLRLAKSIRKRYTNISILKPSDFII
jgi:uncharacterized protein